MIPRKYGPVPDSAAFQRFYTHLQRNSSSIIMSMIFGRRAPRFETSEVDDFFHVQHLWERAIEPGAHPVRFPLR